MLLIFSVSVSLSFTHSSEAEPYDLALKKALELDKDGFYEEAIEYWEQSLKGSPTNIRLYSSLKISGTYTHLGNLFRAEEVSQALTESHPSYYESWFNYANALGALKKYSQAVSAFKKSIEIKPKEGLGKVGLAFAYFGDEKPHLAIAELKGAMRIFKANKNISWYRDCRLATNQIKGFARFPPKFADLWLEKNLKRVQKTFENSVLDFKSILEAN
ncbi:MAG: tetratricopeptide (TPR) repeat protein [Nitrospinales bacterium]